MITLQSLSVHISPSKVFSFHVLPTAVETTHPRSALPGAPRPGSRPAFTCPTLSDSIILTGIPGSPWEQPRVDPDAGGPPLESASISRYDNGCGERRKFPALISRRRAVRARDPWGPVLTEASEYAGQSTVQVACTQLDSGYTPAQARRVVAEWAELLSGEQTVIRDLQFVTRTPKRLFAALSGQVQLRRLVVKWGDYDDLSSLQGLRGLECLELRGASAVTDVGPLAALDQLKALAVEGFHRLDDLTPLGQLNQLTDLELGGNWMAPRNAHIGSIVFLRDLGSWKSSSFTPSLLRTEITQRCFQCRA